MPAIRPSTRAAGAYLAAIGTFVLAGCGGDEEPPSGPPVTVPASDPVEVVAEDFLFDPAAIVVEGGGPLEIVLDNQGAVAHNLTLFDGAEEVGATPTFAGGEQRSTTIDLAPGAYRMVCTVADHEQLGMVGDLEVR